MKAFVLAICLLVGCSTAPKHQQGFPLQFQSPNTHPSALIAADALQPGDLLLSSATSLPS